VLLRVTCSAYRSSGPGNKTDQARSAQINSFQAILLKPVKPKYFLYAWGTKGYLFTLHDARSQVMPGRTSRPGIEARWRCKLSKTAITVKSIFPDPDLHRGHLIDYTTESRARQLPLLTGLLAKLPFCHRPVRSSNLGKLCQQLHCRQI
jgi:hypothetical protein